MHINDVPISFPGIPNMSYIAYLYFAILLCASIVFSKLLYKSIFAYINAPDKGVKWMSLSATIQYADSLLILLLFYVIGIVGVTAQPTVLIKARDYISEIAIVLIVLGKALQGYSIKKINVFALLEYKKLTKNKE